MPLQGADFSVSPLSQNWFRDQVMDFTTHPFYTEESSVMYVLPPAKDRYDIFIKPFKYQVRFMLCVYGFLFTGKLHA